MKELLMLLCTMQEAILTISSVIQGIPATYFVCPVNSTKFSKTVNQQLIHSDQEVQGIPSTVVATTTFQHLCQTLDLKGKQCV